MTFQRMIGRAECLHPGCDWEGIDRGDPKQCDLAARKHLKETGHPVAFGSHPEWSTKEKA